MQLFSKHHVNKYPTDQSFTSNLPEPDAGTFIRSYFECRWHPIYNMMEKDLEQLGWCIKEFKKCREIINRFRIKASDYASDYPRLRKQHEEIYEINLYNKYHPKHHVESWWWVLNNDTERWQISESWHPLLGKYGWHVKSTNDTMVSRL